MSVDTISDDAAVFSRLQLARALKEDPEYIYGAEESAIFQRQRNQTSALQLPKNEFHLPRPMSLLIPPILNDDELHDENSSQPNTPIQVKHSPQQVSQQVRRQSQAFTSSPRNSVIIPDERRGSGSKTLLDVRQSMLENRHNLHNANPFSTSSSHRTSMILQQNKTLPDANGKLRSGNSRPNSLIVSSPRPISTYTINTANSRPTSFYKQNKSFTPDENDEESESSVNSPKTKSQKSSKIKKSSSSSSDGSDSPPTLPPIKSVASQSIILEKVDEEGDSSDESGSEHDDDDDSSSEDDDTPLALKSTPKIKVAPPPRITTGKNNNGRIEAWLEHVSGSPEGSSPNQSPTRSHSPRTKRTSMYNMNQYNSSPLVASHRMSLVVEPINKTQSRRRPISAFVPGDIHAPKPDFHQPRKRSNSEFVPRKRTDSMLIESPIPHGRVSPNPRQDSGYWAKDTLLALSEDLRHVNLMNDLGASSTKSKGSNVSNGSSNKSTNRHRHEGSGNCSKPSSPKLQIPVGGYGSHTNINMNKRLSSELLIPSNRNSILYQQKNRIRS